MQLSKSFFALALLVNTVNAFHGEATFFAPGLGACGKYNTKNDLIVALSAQKYGNGSHCGKKIKVNFKGKSVQAKVVDKCPGCKANDIDLSPAAFSRLADQDLGRIKVSWDFL